MAITKYVPAVLCFILLAADCVSAQFGRSMACCYINHTEKWMNPYECRNAGGSVLSVDKEECNIVNPAPPAEPKPKTPCLPIWCCSMPSGFVIGGTTCDCLNRGGTPLTGLDSAACNA